MGADPDETEITQRFGDIFVRDAVEGNFDSNIAVGMDVNGLYKEQR